MELKIPDFEKDWTELKDDKKVSFLSGKLFAEVKGYVKYEPPDKFFSGSSFSFYGKEVIKIWVTSFVPGKEVVEIMALCLENGEWVTSLSARNRMESLGIFKIEGDPDSSDIKISILTWSGWKSRIIKKIE